MNKFKSKSSPLVLTATIGGSIAFILIIIGIILQMNYLGVWISSLLLFVCIAIPLYILSSSVSNIELTDKNVVINKLFGQKIIPYSTITNAKRMGFSNLTLTVGSQGFFGFVGTTMDGSSSYVKDRKKMVLIETQKGNFILSCENPEELVSELITQVKK